MDHFRVPGKVCVSGPVFDERAEQSVLGSLLHRPSTIGSLGDLRAEHFFKPANALIFATIQSMYLAGEDIDSVTVFAKLDKNRELARAGGAPYLSDLLQAFKSVDNAGTYAQIVIDAWRLRKVNEFGVRCMNIRADIDEVDPALEEVRRFLDEVDSQRDVSSENFTELYETWTEWLHDDRPSIETPWHKVNAVLSGGMQRKRMYVVGARPGCGKTIMCSQIGLYAAQLGHRSLIFSLELSKDDLMGRILACGARVPYEEITSRNLSTRSLEAISSWTAASSNLKFSVDDTPDLTIEEITQRCRIHKQRQGLDVVVIDYIGEIAESKGDNQVQSLEHIARCARLIAKKLDVVVVIASQLNRKIEDNHGKPRLPVKSDFRGSGGVEQAADVAMVLTRPPDENGEESKIPMMNVSFVKNRTGVETTVQLRERFDMAMFQ